MAQDDADADVLGQVSNATFTIQGPSIPTCDVASGSTIRVGDVISCGVILSPGASINGWSALFDWNPPTSATPFQSFTAVNQDGGAVIVASWHDPDGTYQFSNWTYAIEDAPPPQPGMLRVTTNPGVPAQILVDGMIRDTWGLELAEACTGQLHLGLHRPRWLHASSRPAGHGDERSDHDGRR